MVKLNQELKDYQYLFLDMDSFFASVEQQVRPKLRGKPIGVAPFTGDTGCIIAPSIEAKEYGVKTGQRVKEGERHCPSLKIIEARPKLYLIYHKEIKKALKSLTPFLTPLSVDEFRIKLGKNEQNEKASLKLGQIIKKEINKQVGDNLSLSIGIGPNSFLAKLAGEENKPDGLKTVKLNELTHFYKNLDLTDLTGISTGMKRRLISKNITTPLEFYRSSLSNLTTKLGVRGRSWFFKLRGYELIQKETKKKSIGHSHVLPPEFRNKKGAWQIIRKLIHKVGKKLRANGFQAQKVSTSINFYKGANFSKNIKAEPFDDNKSLHKYVFHLLKKCSWQHRPRKVAIRTSKLVKSEKYQPSLLENTQKSRQFSKALDKLNDKLGQETIYQASMHLGKDEAPDRISFGRPKF